MEEGDGREKPIQKDERMRPWFRRGPICVLGLLAVIFLSVEDYPSQKFTGTDCDSPSCPAASGKAESARAHTRIKGSLRSVQGHVKRGADPDSSSKSGQGITKVNVVGGLPMGATTRKLKESWLGDGADYSNSNRNVLGEQYLRRRETVKHMMENVPEVKNNHSDPERNTENGFCKMPKRTPLSDSIAQELFFSEPRPACDYPQRRDICTVSVLAAMVSKVRCRGDLCHGNLSLGLLTPDTGELQWEKLESLARLETKIAVLIKQRAAANVYQRFCFIRCNTYGEQLGEVGRAISQLLMFPPPIDWAGHNSNRPVDPPPISINIIHIDSISRRHFYRSLPRTAAVLQRLGRGENNLSNAIKVLDFRLLQTLKGRTYESLRLLFTGQLPPRLDLMSNPTDSDEEPSNSSIALEQLMAPLKRDGFATLYLEDMCWESGWGLVRHLGVSRSQVGRASEKRKEVWGKLMRAINSSLIDDVGPSFSSCELLRAYGVSHPFHGPPSICANGRYQHDYAFDYLHQFQRQMNALRKPFFSFLMTNVAHEPTGRRVQTLDESLCKYLASIATLDNQVTIVTADHGNSYGEYVENTLQGRIEMFNPPLFILMPKSVANSLGPNILRALENNQNNLVTFLDLHLFLKQLTHMPIKHTTNRRKHQKYVRAKYMRHTGSKAELSSLDELLGAAQPQLMGAAHSKQGLHMPLPINRTCDDLPMFVDTICICDGHFTRAAPQPRYVLLAAFALGQLNNRIQAQRVNANVSPATAKSTGCLPLTLHSLVDVWVRQQGEMTTVRMHVMVVPDLTQTNMNSRSNNINFTPEAWTLSVLWTPGSPKSSNMTLSSATRLSQYGHFRACADPSVDIKLCMCAFRTSSLEENRRNDSGKLTQRPGDVVSLGLTSSGQQTPARPLPGNAYQTITTPSKQSARLHHSNNHRSLDVYDNKTRPHTILHGGGDDDGWTRRTLIKRGFYLGSTEIHSIPSGIDSCVRVLVRRNTMGAVFWAKNLCSNKRRVLLSLDVSNMDVSSGTASTIVRPNQSVFLAVCVQSSPNLNFHWKYKAQVT